MKFKQGVSNSIMKKILIFIFIVFFTKNLFAYSLYDKGGNKCHEYVSYYELGHQNFLKMRNNNGIYVDESEYIKILELNEWLVYYYGYVTAMNVENKSDMFRSMDASVIAIELNNYCKTYTDHYFATAIANTLNKYLK